MCAVRTFVWRLREALPDDSVEHRRREQSYREWLWVALQNRGGDARLALSFKSAPAGNHLVEHGAEREDVAARICLLTLELFRRHVGQRSENGTIGSAHRIAIRSARFNPNRFSAQFRQTEIE